MRHRKSGVKLNRNSSHRKALFRNLSIAFIEHKIIKTTVVKAKELRRHIEPLITLTKIDSVASRRNAYRYLNNKTAVGVLFQDFSQYTGFRNGGYTRVVKAGARAGDNAPLAYIEWVDRQAFANGEKAQPIPSKSKTKKKIKPVIEKITAAANNNDTSLAADPAPERTTATSPAPTNTATATDAEK